MVYDIQKAGFWKRLSAWMLDAILLLFLAVGVSLILSPALKFDSYYDTMESISQRYEEEAGVSFDVTAEEYAAMTEAEQAELEAAYGKFAADKEAVHAYNMLTSLSVVIVSISALVACLVLEFAVPMALKNGQTVGKKIFGLGVMRAHGVKVDGVCMFIRTVLGKYTIEIMVPVMLMTMVFWGILGIVGPIVVVLMLLLQVILMFATRTNSTIHDLLAHTVAIDLQSQMIFDTEEDLIAYKKRIHEDMVNRSSY
ncbi:MAG: RDD family protein [Ruminococcaceae bacterium]|nr:RDD family protein [Oscillospiraceae bacterium]